MKERWKDIKGYESLYKVSDLGRVKSYHYDKKNGRMMKSYLGKGNYHTVHLSKNRESKNRLVNRLVAEAFVPNPQNKPQVHHKNGNKLDNRASNLEWCTNKENQGAKNKMGNLISASKGNDQLSTLARL